MLGLPSQCDGIQLFLMNIFLNLKRRKIHEKKLGEF